MPMNSLERDFLAKLFAVSKTVLQDLQPRLSGLNELYNAAGIGISNTLTQDELDELAELSGLTVQQVADATYALTAVILPGITNAYPALAQTSARFL
jgi:translation initiation factor 6 (eIF-6)